jgi:hypothetical protein
MNQILAQEALFGFVAVLTTKKRAMAIGRPYQNRRLLSEALKFSLKNHLSDIPAPTNSQMSCEEALFGFVGYLMNQNSVRVGGNYPCSSLLCRIDEFTHKHRLWALRDGVYPDNLVLDNN